MKKSVFIIIVVLFAALLACASYKPKPAPVPMATIQVYAGQTYSDTFTIADPNGPLGLTIQCEPSGLVIEEPNILLVDGYPDARLYVYDFTFKAISTGTKTFTITSTDSLGVVVINKLVFNVAGNDPQVFIGVGDVPVSADMTMGDFLEAAQNTMRNNARSNLVFHYNRVVEGKEPLSPKYPELDYLEDLIAKYKDPASVVMQGHLVED
jgi:phospholipase/lecithinase/hemolysin